MISALSEPQSRIYRLKITCAIRGRGALDTYLVKLTQLFPKLLLPCNKFRGLWWYTLRVLCSKKAVKSRKAIVQPPLSVLFEPQQSARPKCLTYRFGAGILQENLCLFNPNTWFKWPLRVCYGIPV